MTFAYQQEAAGLDASEQGRAVESELWPRSADVLFTMRIKMGVIALSLRHGAKAAVAPADEQVNANERTLGVHVAAGGLKGVLDTLTKPPAAAWFFNP